MNVLYIHTHDTGRYIQPYNPSITTPHLMQLAEEGTLFRQAHCCSPTCSPSRAALLTGQHPHMNGMCGLAHRGFSIEDKSKHLANYLKQFGFETALFGMQHEDADPNKIGYDRLFIDKRRESEDLTVWDISNGDAAISYLREPHDKPFFMSYGLAHTHRPFLEVDPSINPDYIMVPHCLPDHKETREDFAGYITSAIRADHCIGRVLEELKVQGLEEDTIILYTTDHGIAFPHMKCNLYDTGTGVSMILRYKGNPLKGKVSDALISHVDVYPTLCELLNIKKPDWLTGSSFLSILKEEKEEINEAVFSEITYHAAADPQRAVRTKNYKYIKKYGSVNQYIPANIDNGFSKDYLIKQGLRKYSIEDEMLFDLALDPAERNNVAEHKNYEVIKKHMKSLLENFIIQTNDFIETGIMPRPKGLILNKVTCLDPDSPCKDDYE